MTGEQNISWLNAVNSLANYLQERKRQRIAEAEANFRILQIEKEIIDKEKGDKLSLEASKILEGVKTEEDFLKAQEKIYKSYVDAGIPDKYNIAAPFIESKLNQVKLQKQNEQAIDSFNTLLKTTTGNKYYVNGTLYDGSELEKVITSTDPVQKVKELEYIIQNNGVVKNATAYIGPKNEIRYKSSYETKSGKTLPVEEEKQLQNALLYTRDGIVYADANANKNYDSGEEITDPKLLDNYGKTLYQIKQDEQNAAIRNMQLAPKITDVVLNNIKVNSKDEDQKKYPILKNAYIIDIGGEKKYAIRAEIHPNNRMTVNGEDIPAELQPILQSQSITIANTHATRILESQRSLASLEKQLIQNAQGYYIDRKVLVQEGDRYRRKELYQQQYSSVKFLKDRLEFLASLYQKNKELVTKAEEEEYEQLTEMLKPYIEEELRYYQLKKNTNFNNEGYNNFTE